MKLTLFTGLLVATSTNTAIAATHQARCEVNEGEALAWVSARHDQIAIKAKAVIRVFDSHGSLIYKTSDRKNFALDAYDTEKIYAIDVGYDARWCELDLKDTEISVHTYEEPVVVHHQYHSLFPTPPIVIYKQPRRETVLIERQRPAVRVYESGRSRSERIVTRAPRSQTKTRVRIAQPAIQIRLGGRG